MTGFELGGIQAALDSSLPGVSGRGDLCGSYLGHLREVQRYLGLRGRTGDTWDARGIDTARFVLVEKELRQIDQASGI